jgi:transposase
MRPERNFFRKQRANGKGYPRKLTPEQVRLIRKWHGLGDSQLALAAAFDVSASCINDVLHRYYQDVTDEEIPDAQREEAEAREARRA